MDHYFDISLLPDPEFSQPELMNALFAKLHLALVAVGGDDIGASFPEHAVGLGGVMRLHGSAPRLSQLMGRNWLGGMRDQVATGPVQPVPATCTGYRVVSRRQAKSNPARERRRLMRRQGLTETQALAKIPDQSTEALDLPSLQLHSQSTGQRFLLFVQHGPIEAKQSDGRFSAYGLSASGSIPWF